MLPQDLSQNLKVDRLTKLRGDLKQSRSPEESLRALQRGFSDGNSLFGSLLVSTRGLGPGQYRVVRTQLADQPAGNAVATAGSASAPVQSGGVVAAITAPARPQLLQNVDWAEDPFFCQMLRGCESVIALPIAGDRLPMNWAILLKKAPERFTVSDLEEALERSILVGALLENQALAAELALAHERIDQEARQVGELQRALLPAAPLQVPNLEIATYYEPSSRAGGDLYDFFSLDPLAGGPAAADQAAAGASRWCVFIGDSAGHGLAAAVVMAIVQAVLRAHPPHVVNPAGLLAHANRQLCGRQIGGFLTAFLGVYEPAIHRLTYANAGHPPPLLRRALDGSVRRLDAVGSYPLGIDDAETFAEATVELEPGSTLLFYTDGIIEARAARSDDLFGIERLIALLGDEPAHLAELVERIRQVVSHHRAGEDATDDQTIVAARVM
jgi:sigma-B regulation protein RsbU (phosphoserine phosphatase)